MRRTAGLLVGGGLGLCALALMSSDGPARAAQNTTHPIKRMTNPAFLSPDHFDQSPPLREMPEIAPNWAELDRHEVKRWAHQHPLLTPAQLMLFADPARQAALTSAITPALSASAGLNFDGVGVPSYTPTGAPPDTEGAVGATQYVQWVNTAFAVFNKSTGAVIYGPVAGNTVWQGFGGSCETDNDGDPIVMYDKAANRWLMMQFAVTGGPPYYQCVAVSTTSDATGTWNRYSYQFADFNDYPKGGVWPDAYYVTYNMFAGGVTFSGAQVCAMDRSAMLNGTAATQQCFQLSSNYGGLLPGDLDGATPPPVGSPEYVLAFDDVSLSALNLWKFHVDWTTPSNSTLTGPTSLPVAAFAEACNGGTCIPQAGTSQQVDSLADRMMYRLAYRNFGDHEALVTNHSVTSAGVSGVRWYEIRSPGGTPAVTQQSTFQPDATYRWMGSVAMDHVGNMLLGYSASSSSLHPSVRVTGRLSTDPLNTLQAETVVVTGNGSQSGQSLTRWGDYSAMQIDPADDCTFWYTQEYEQSTGAFNWSTRIATFKFPSCATTATPDFSVSDSPGSVTVAQGGSGTSTITVGSLNGFSSAVSLSASGVPSGVTASFSPVSVTPPANGSGASTLTLTASSSATTGTAVLTVTGTSGSTTHTTTVSLTVAAAPNFSVSASPSSVTVAQGGSGTSTITVGSLNGFSSAVSLSASGVPSGVTASFSPVSVTPPANGSGASTLTLTASSSATTGTAVVTVTGTSGSTTHSTTVSITVTTAPNFSVSASPSSLTVAQGGSGTSTITVGSLNGFSSAVSLSASGVPSGVTASFSPGSVTPPANGSGASTLTLTASSSATTGTAVVTVTGTSGSTTHSATVNLTVTAAPDFSVSASPSSVTVVQGGSSPSTITVGSLNGFSSAVSLSATGQPGGVTASFSPASVTPPANGSAPSTLTLSASVSAAVGTYTVTATGTSGSTSHSATITLTITSPGGALTATYDPTLKAPKCASVGNSCDSGPSLLLGRDSMSGGAEPNQPNNVNSSCADGTSGTFHSDESNDRIVVATTDGSAFAPGKTVKVTATVWAWNTGSSDALDLYYAADATSPTWTPIQTSIVPTAGGAQALSATYTLPTGGSLQAVRANFRYLGSASPCSGGSYDEADDLIFAVGAGSPDFTIAASPASVTVTQGGSGTSTLTVASLGGFSSATSLSASGLPSGVTAAFSATPVTPPANGSATSTLTLTASASATTGPATVTLSAISGSLTHSTTLSLTVNTPGGGPQSAVYDTTLKAPKCATVGSSCDSGASLLLGRDNMSGGAEAHQPNTINNSCADGTSGTFHSDESNDRIVVATTDGSPLAHGKTVKITATVWAWSTGSSDALDLYYAANASSPTWVFIATIVPPAGGVQNLSATYTLPTGSLQAVRANFRYQGRASACSTGAYDDHDDLVFAVQ